MKRLLFYVCLFALGLLALSFALMNVNEVKLSYYLGSIEAPLSLIVVLSLAIGASLGVSALLGLVLRLKRENFTLKNKLDKTIKQSEKELHSLRSLPLKDAS